MIGVVLAVVADVVAAAEAAPADPAEVVIGERLFLETRFAQFFAAHAGADVNQPLLAGDPVVATTETLSGAIPNPFRGQAMNCRSCHFVDDQKETPGGGSRAYNDFARQSPIPARADGALVAPRNSPVLVGSTLSRRLPLSLHFDGEFPSAMALVRGTFTGRNLGWLPDESGAAIAHIARVIREDDGTVPGAAEAGGAYRRVLAGRDASLPRALRLPRRFRLDIARASDEDIMDGVARLVAAYVESLDFARDDSGAFNGSPYDRFLQKNRIPRKPSGGESTAAYLGGLRSRLAATTPTFIDSADGKFELHPQSFQFGPAELEGLQVFLSPTRGNCVACHVPPNFTDFGFHNTGVSQRDYDHIHGAGGFAAIFIPDAATRAAAPDVFLPRSPLHPQAAEPFRAVLNLNRPGATDLGMWNIFQNPDHDDRRFQRSLARHVCTAAGIRSGCRHRVQLEQALGLFKAPTLRDLGHSAPYFHAGSVDTLEETVQFYVDASAAAHAGTLRNGARELLQMNLLPTDVAPLAAFLRALNEDYE